MQKLLSFVEMNNPGLCFGLRLHAVVAADRCAISASKQDDRNNDFASIAYEFMSEAFSTYESEITESTTQRSAVTSIVGVLLLCQCFDKTSYETLITKTTQYAARLSKKTDQCSMVLMCSHLFFKEEVCRFYLLFQIDTQELFYSSLIFALLNHRVSIKIPNGFLNACKEH